MRELALIRISGAASLSAIVLLPTPAVLVGATFAFWASLSFTTPFQLRVWGSSYPARMRGRVFGFLGMGRAAATAAGALLGALLADRVGGFTAMAIGGLIGAACASAYAWYPTSVRISTFSYTARDSFRALRERPTLVRLVLAQSLFGGGLIAAGSLFALVYVDRLDLSLPDIGTIGVLTSLSAMASLTLWGTISDRFSPLVAMQIGSVIGVVALIAYAVAEDVALVWPAAAMIGAGTAGVDLGTVSSLTDETTPDSRAAVASAWNATGGARGLVAPFVVSVLVQAGALDVRGAIVLCALVSATGMAILWFAAPRPRAVGPD
jgi:nitrate/nitrite transporter NarK